MGVFGNGPSKAANRNFPRPIPVAVTTKFETKLAITQLVQEISARFFCICGKVFGNGPSNTAN